MAMLLKCCENCWDYDLCRHRDNCCTSCDFLKDNLCTYKWSKKDRYDRIGKKLGISADEDSHGVPKKFGKFFR